MCVFSQLLSFVYSFIVEPCFFVRCLTLPIYKNGTRTWTYIRLCVLLPIRLTSRRRRWHPTPVLLPGKSHGQRSLGCHGVIKSRTRLSDFPFTFHFHALEKEMATCSSVPAWRIPGTGEPGWLPSMGSHRVGLDWSDLAAAAAGLPPKFFVCGIFVLSLIWENSNLNRSKNKFLSLPPLSYLKIYIYIFIFGCTGSSLLCRLSLVEHGLQVWGFQDLQPAGSLVAAHRLNSCGAQA